MEIMKPLFIFDIDGTLADGTHRVHHIMKKPKDWDTYFSLCLDDAPIAPVIHTLKALRAGGADIWYFSGRSDVVRYETAQWLVTHVGADPAHLDAHLHMRPEKDHQPDDDLKRSWLLDMLPIDRERLIAIYDDRDRVVAMWRAMGVQCFQVAPGEF